MRAFLPRCLGFFMQSIQALQASVADDIDALNRLILKELHSDVMLVNKIGDYIVGAGGKRLRPLLVLLSANACNYQGENHIYLATIIEFIHTATLLHDDVVDASDMRRGHSTANSLWGNAPSVLVGDFLYSRAFQLLNKIGSLPIMKIMADTTNLIAEGEVLQLMNCNDPNTTEAAYLQVIHYKTAALFAAAAKSSAVLANTDENTQESLYAYGLQLGIAFQLVDDVLDYRGNKAIMGKNVGDDLAEGKPTLPLIYAMQHASAQQQKIIRHTIENGGLDHLDEILIAIEDTHALEYSMQKAQIAATAAQKCLMSLAPSSYKEALLALTNIAISRSV
jgi:octaprenyl-diphosphate synthase